MELPFVFQLFNIPQILSSEVNGIKGIKSGRKGLDGLWQSAVYF